MEQSALLEELSKRVAQLEGKGSLGGSPLNDTQAVWASGLLGAGALCLLFLGVGLPNHPYQLLGAGAIGAVGYVKGRGRNDSPAWRGVLALLNFALVALVLKLVIGGGIRRPFFWAELPQLGVEKGGTTWLPLPQWRLQWIPTQLAEWEVDLTRFQSAVLALGFAAHLFRIQPLFTLATVVLSVCALPFVFSYDWNYLFPGIVLATLAIYLQRR